MVKGLFLGLLLGATPVFASSPLSAPTIPDDILGQSKADRLEWAYRYQHGEGVEPDQAFALELLCGLAWGGNAEAAYEVGWIYLHGRGVPANEGLATTWIQLAAKANDPLARRLLRRLDSAKSAPEPSCAIPEGNGGVRLVAPQITPRDRVRYLVDNLAPRFELEPELVLAVIETESGFNPKAVSHAGAQGLMQLIPATAKRFDVEDPFDPAQNLRGGMTYLRWLLDHFDGDLKKALAGYNAGEGAVRRYQGIPPYRETQDYVVKVLRRFQRNRGETG